MIADLIASLIDGGELVVDASSIRKPPIRCEDEGFGHVRRATQIGEQPGGVKKYREARGELVEMFLDGRTLQFRFGDDAVKLDLLFAKFVADPAELAQILVRHGAIGRE